MKHLFTWPATLAAIAFVLAATAQAQFSVSDRLVAHYRFDGSAYDFAGTAHGAASQVSYGADRFGKAGRALVLSGNSGSQVAINSTNWNLPPEFTVSVWFNFTANLGTENPRVLSAAGWEIGTQTTASSRRIFFNNTTATSGAFGVDSTNSYPAGTWIHAVGVRSSNQLTLYVNGVLAGTVSVPQSPDYSRGMPKIGGNFGNGFDAFGGSVDDLRIYNRGLSASEVQQLHAFEVAIPPISLTENLWPNPSLEADSDGDGIPDFWNKGGTDVSLDIWETNNFSSGSHCLAVWDTNTNGYGTWFSDRLPVTSGGRYLLRFKRSYCAIGGGMRVTLRYSTDSNTTISAPSFSVFDCQLPWQDFSSELVVPPGASHINLEMVSAGGGNVVGTNRIDDISLVALWPNPSLELDSDGDGSPDFWNKGGTDHPFDIWSTDSPASGSRCLAIHDNSPSGYGHWYSDMVSVLPGDRYTLSFSRRYCGNGPMTYAARFFSTDGGLLNSTGFAANGCQPGWEQIAAEIVVPNGAFKMDCGFESAGSVQVLGTNWLDDVLISVGPRVTLISTGAVWRYLDDGTDQGFAWSQPWFNDTAWAAGPAQLGYGDGDEATVVGFGPDAANKFPTTYFRHSFAVPNAALFTNLNLRLLRDDGAVVYLNGVEIWRSNMPTNQVINYATLATTNVGGATETTYFEFSTDASLLSNGVNVIAVEVHQASRTNTSDCSFDLELSANANFAQAVQPDVGFYDDFEPDIHFGNWSQFGGSVLANGNGESVSGANGLWFGGSGSRFAATRPLNMSRGGVIDFYLRFANGSDPTWERPELPSEGIVLEYSLDATNWLNIATYTNTYFAWTPFQAVVPVAARSSATLFRWRQLANSGGSFDHWALDDVRISGPPVITSQPLSQTGYVQSSVTLSVTADSLLPAFFQWFFQGAAIVGQTNATLTITNISLASAGSYFVIVSNSVAAATSSVASITFSPALVRFGSVWKFFDHGFQPAENWAATNFDDAQWSSGPAQLGYGDGDEATLVSFGPQSTNKFITTYFRRTFPVTDPSAFTNLLLRLVRDDGVVVYINGTEVFRNNLPGSPVTYETRALWPVSDENRLEETNYVRHAFTANALIAGVNTIAVEVHQANLTSTDMSFDLELTANAVVSNQAPIALIAAPANGQTYSANGSLLLRAIAFDLDGAISRVEFFAGTNKLGEVPGTNVFSGYQTNQFTFAWSNLPPGNYVLRAVVTDDAGATGESQPVNVVVLSSVKYPLVASGAVWKFLDDGSNQGTNWVQSNFDDSAWQSGPAQLGYGDGDEATVVSYGPVATNKFITTYFRRTFVVDDAALFDNLTLMLLRDDGAVLYLNGHEVFRSNLPTNGPIAFNTLATATLGEPAENTFVPAVVPSGLLRSGTNVIAVEIHQANRTSSDLGFDLSFGVSGVPGTPLVSVNGKYDPRDVYVATNAASIGIQTAFANGVILYTLDGSAPSLDSTLYEGPFTVSNSVTVRAIAYTADFSQVVEAPPVAVIVLPTLRLSVSVQGSGQVILNPSGGAYVSNTLVTATAIAAPQWRFLSWAGASTSTNSVTTVLMNTPKQLQAIFEPTAFCLDAVTVAGGTAVPLPPALVGLWSAEDNANDAVAGNHLTLFNGASFANGSLGRAFSFDGVDDWAGRLNAVAITNTDNWSIAARVFWRGLSSNTAKNAHIIFNNGRSGFNGFGMLVFDRGGCQAFGDCDAPGRITVAFGGIMHIPTGVPLPTNVWTHIVVTRESGILRLFTNGALAFSTATSAPNPPSPDGAIKISDQGSDSFNGLIDEVAVSDRAITATEVAALNGNQEQCAPVGGTLFLAAHAAPGWRFLKWLDDAEGTNSTIPIAATRAKRAQPVFGTTLATTVSGNGSVAMDPPGGVYPFGTIVRLTATAGPGSYFALWGNAVSATTNPLLFTITNATPAVSCLFNTLPANQFSLTIVESGFGRVIVSPSGSKFASGQNVTLTALPASGQTFVGWSGDATGTNSPLTLLMDRSRTVAAQFTKRPTLANRAVNGLGDGAFRMHLSGEFGQAYRVDASSDLMSWTPVAVITNLFGTGQFTDLETTNYPLRFYRASPSP